MAPLQHKPPIPADAITILCTIYCCCCCTLNFYNMKDDPLFSHKKHKLTRLEAMMGPVAFSARKKRPGASGGTNVSNYVVVSQSQTLDYFRESPPSHSPFANPTICPNGSPLADATAINKMVSGVPVGGLSLGAVAEPRELFNVTAHNQKNLTSKAVKLTAFSIFPWLRQSRLTQLKVDLQEK
jgi:hypothetical protein